MAEVERDAVCARIAQARREKGLTQPEVADLLSLSLRSYQDYESVRVPFRRMGELADIFGVTKRWLLYGDEQPAEPPPAAFIEEIRSLTNEIRRLIDRLDDGEGGAATS